MSPDDHPTPPSDPTDPAGGPTRSVGLAPGESASMAVVATVADLLGRGPQELEPLSARVDPDALDALLRDAGDSDDGGVTVSFRFAGCAVVVTPDRVEVRAEPSAGT